MDYILKNTTGGHDHDGVDSKLITTGADSDGWTSVSGWSYASATTITVSSGAASIYQIGDKIRFQNNDSGTYLYGYVVAVADTTLTILGDAVPNATLTDTYYSHAESPLGHPIFFDHTPSFTGFSSNPSGFSCKYTLKGRLIWFKYQGGYTVGTSNSANFTITLPRAVGTLHAVNGVCRVYDNGAWIAAAGMYEILAASATLTFGKTGTGTGGFTASGNKDAQVNLLYGI